MLVLGQHDAMIPLSMAQAFYEAADTPKKELVSIDAEHHSLYMPGKGLEPAAGAAARWIKEHS